MCVIGAKRRGLLLPQNIESVMRHCFISNSHGAGFAIKKAGHKEIYYEKGLMTFPNFLAAFRNLGNIDAADEFVMHFRIRTWGETNERMTHPFIISNDFHEVHGIRGDKTSGHTTKDILFHNGIISAFNLANPKVSDTFNFTHQFMSKFKPSLQHRALTKWQKEFKRYTSGQRMAFMFGSDSGGGELELLGHYVEHENMFYSNTYWKPRGKNWSEYYDRYHELV